jgi:hypothetical protein
MNRFNAVAHEYYIDDRKLMSVTELIGTYERLFNANMVAQMVANKSGRDKDDILNEWDLKRDIAVDYGNSIHKSIELWVKYEIEPTQPHLLKAVRQFDKQFGDIEWLSEHRVFNHKYELGGTLDLYSKTQSIIADVKTNDTLKEEKKGNFITPLNKVKVNNLNKVRLQAKVYEVLVEKECTRFVYHWDGEVYNVIELEDIDVQPILEIRKQKLEKAKLVEDMF